MFFHTYFFMFKLTMRIFLILIFLSFPALASVLAEEIRVTSSTMCNVVTQYQPGTGSNNVRVAPADLNASAVAAPDPVIVPLEIDLAEFLNIGAVREGVALEPEIGTVAIYLDGRVLYNGQDISSSIQMACGITEQKAQDKPVSLQTQPQPQPQLQEVIVIPESERLDGEAF